MVEVSDFDAKEILQTLEETAKEHPKQSTRWNAMYLAGQLRRKISVNRS